MNRSFMTLLVCLAAAGCADAPVGTTETEEPGGPEQSGLPPANGGAAGQQPGSNLPPAQSPDSQQPPAEQPPQNTPPAEQPPPETPPAEQPSGCDFSGTAAVKIVADVSWPGGIAVEAGGGQIHIWFRATLDHVGNVVLANGPVCGVEIPDFHTNAIAGGDTHGTYLPEAVWQSPLIPQAELEVQLGGADPGASMVANPTATLLGVELADPVNDPWPNSYRDVRATDHDQDGRPGVTALSRSGGAYSNPRVDLFDANQRASELYLALRTIIGLNGQITSCDSAEGQATLLLDQRVVGCRLETGGDCRPNQVDMIDRNVPVFQVNGATFRLSRVADAATCDEIRAALP